MLINVNITDITDESGYIEAIGQKAASQAIQQARGDVAEQEKLGEIARGRGRAREGRPGGRAPTSSARSAPARPSASRPSAIAELRKGTEGSASRPPAFEREAQVKDAERTMRIALADANAKAIAGENEAQAEIAASQAELAGEAGRGLPAWARLANARPKPPCWKPRTGPWPRPRWPRRNASRPNAAPRSKPRPRPKRPRSIVEAEAEAEKRRIEAEGEASAIFAKLEAEARGQYEILAKKGEGLKRDHRRLRRRPASLPAADARTPRPPGRGLGRRRSRTSSSTRSWSGRTAAHNGTTQHGQLPAKHGPHAAADDAGACKDIGGVELPESLVKLGATDSDNGDVAPNVPGNGLHAKDETAPVAAKG